MASTKRVSVHDLEGAGLEAFIADHIARFGFPPLAGGDGEPDPAGGDPGGDPAPDPKDDPKADPAPDPKDPKGDGDPDWKAQSRKHEREKKAAFKELEALRKEAEERANAAKTDQEKALEQARKEARDEALSEASQARRADKLEVAVTRSAAKTFADPDDALTHLERAIARKEIDEDELFDDEGKVQTDALNTALEELLERKPHLAASEERRFQGGTGAGKGGGSGKSLRDMTPEEHLARQQQKR